MPEENTELVRRSFDAFNAQDVSGFMELYADDAVVETDPRFPEGGVFDGRAALRRFFEGLYEGWAGGSEAELRRLTDAPGGRVLAEFVWRGTGEASGIETRFETLGLYTIRDGRITRAQFFFDRAEALRAAGLES